METRNSGDSPRRSEANAYVLSDLADCGLPDTPDSPGAKFLLGVQDAVNEVIENETQMDHVIEPDEWAHDIADNAVPIYTFAKWQTFVDLAAWQEDLDDYGTPRDMNVASNWALYSIAQRLAEVLFEEAAERSATEALAGATSNPTLYVIGRDLPELLFEEAAESSDEADNTGNGDES